MAYQGYAPMSPQKMNFSPLIEEKLFFILAYQKKASPQEFFAASFDTDKDWYWLQIF